MNKEKAKKEEKPLGEKISETQEAGKNPAEDKPEQEKDNTMNDNKNDIKTGKAPNKADKDLLDVDKLISEHKLPAWRGAALCRNEGWAPGKKISKKDFDLALELLKNRPLGG